MNKCLESVLSGLSPDEKLVVVTAENCLACKAIKEEVSGYPVGIVPVESPEGNELANKAGLNFFPSLLVVKGTEPVAKVSLGTCLLTGLTGKNNQL